MKPPFLQNQFIFGNERSNVAVCSRWTTRERMKEMMEKDIPAIMEHVAFVANLYSPQRGLDVIVRNLIACPWIDTIIMTGKDLSGVTKEVNALFGGRLHSIGVDSHQDRTEPIETNELVRDGITWTIPGTRLRIGADVPLEEIEKVRDRVTVIEENTVEDVGDAVFQNSRDCIAVEGPLYPPKILKPDLMPGPYSVHPIRAKTIADGYVELLYQILTFGKKVHTHYDQDTLELMDLIVVITEEPGRFEGELHPSMPFDKAHLRDYLIRFMSKEKVPDVSYTYGNLMQEYFGANQIEKVIMRLVADPNSRAAVISLWDPTEKSKSNPCLNHLWFRIMDRKLFLTATIRSNDMFFGWPENAYALRSMQEYVRGAILSQMGHVMDDPEALGLGDLIIMSQSAHIYEDCWAPAKDIVAAHRKPGIWFDEKGQWIIEPRADRQINMELCDPDGLSILELIGTPVQVMKEIRDRRLVSDVGHALWLGMQIGKEVNKVIIGNEPPPRLKDLEALWSHTPGDVKAYARQKVHLERLKEKKDEEEHPGEETDETGA